MHDVPICVRTNETRHHSQSARTHRVASHVFAQRGAPIRTGVRLNVPPHCTSVAISIAAHRLHKSSRDQWEHPRVKVHHTTPLPAVLALGSPHGDDQAAWSVVDRLQQDADVAVHCLRLASPWDIVDHVRSGHVAVIVDACRSGAPAGTVHCIAAHDLPTYRGIETSTHGGSLPDALELCGTLGYDVSQITIYAVELETVERTTAMSPAVEQAVAQLARRIRQQWAHEQPDAE